MIKPIANLAVTVTFGFLLFSTQAVMAGNIEQGKEKSATCATCHGPDGNSPAPTFPNLAGQYADYLVVSLKAYRSGARKNAIMAGFAAGLSDEDIEDLAAYYASQKGLSIVKQP